MDAGLLKRWIVGRPMPLAQARHERLSKTVALAVFSSDALSSVAYATEEILLVLVLAGAAAAHLSVPLAFAITGLLFIVVVSYQQTIHAYPSGGGSYIVARANLGATPGLIAAAALLIDYVLTVSVSVAAEERARDLRDHRLLLARRHPERPREHGDAEEEDAEDARHPAHSDGGVPRLAGLEGGHAVRDGFHPR